MKSILLTLFSFKAVLQKYPTKVPISNFFPNISFDYVIIRELHIIRRHRFDDHGTNILENVVAGRYRRRIFKNQLTTNSEFWGSKHAFFAFIAPTNLFLTEYTCRKSSVLKDVLWHHSARNASRDGDVGR
jgi:hypothetical protein